MKVSDILIQREFNRGRHLSWYLLKPEARGDRTYNLHSHYPTSVQLNVRATLLDLTAKTTDRVHLGLKIENGVRAGQRLNKYFRARVKRSDSPLQCSVLYASGKGC